MRKIVVLLMLAGLISFPRFNHKRDLIGSPINRSEVLIHMNCPECVDLPEATCGRMLPPKR